MCFFTLFKKNVELKKRAKEVLALITNENIRIIFALQKKTESFAFVHSSHFSTTDW